VSLSQGDRGTIGPPGIQGDIGYGFPGAKVTVIINIIIVVAVVVIVIIDNTPLCLIERGYNTRED